MSLEIDAPTGLLRGARQVLSPHHDARPPGCRPELIVLHGISLPPGEFGGPWIDALFAGDLPAAAHPYFESLAEVQVSAHALVQRDGTLVQYVPFEARAWHAGPSNWHGREACNDYSVGIELEGVDEAPYTDSQYAACADLVLALCAAYATLSTERMVGHSEIAPGRKTDPGPAFDWQRLRAALVEHAQRELASREDHS